MSSGTLQYRDTPVDSGTVGTFGLQTGRNNREWEFTNSNRNGTGTQMKEKQMGWGATLRVFIFRTTNKKEKCVCLLLDPNTRMPTFGILITTTTTIIDGCTYVATKGLGASGKLDASSLANRVFLGFVRVQADLGVDTEALADLVDATELAGELGVGGVGQGGQVLDRQGEPEGRVLVA